MSAATAMPKSTGNQNGGIMRQKSFTMMTAPAASPDRIRRLAARKALHAQSNQRANDDTRLSEIRAVRQLFSSEDQQQGDSKRFNAATITRSRYQKFPVYTIMAVSNDRVVLCSIGTPHREVGVIPKSATFNGISMREFGFKDILQNGDHVLVEKLCYWYDNGNYYWKAMAISFPRYSYSDLEKGDTWITHGTVSVIGNDVIGVWLIDTEVAPLNDETDQTIMIRAPQKSFVNVNMEMEEPCIVESTVVIRASLEREGKPWSKAATGFDTPWEAKVVTKAAGVREGKGYLKHGFRNSLVIIGMNGFGYVYVPTELITEQLQNAPDSTPVHFEACINRIPYGTKKDRTVTKYKWRAVFVEIDNGTAKSSGRGWPPRTNGANGANGAKKPTPIIEEPKRKESQRVVRFADTGLEGTSAVVAISPVLFSGQDLDMVMVMDTIDYNSNKGSTESAMETKDEAIQVSLPVDVIELAGFTAPILVPSSASDSTSTPPKVRCSKCELVCFCG